MVLVVDKMEKEIMIGALGLVAAYFLLRLGNRKQSSSAYSDILSDDKYKVKGQWGR